jgi:hypothetical protein
MMIPEPGLIAGACGVLAASCCGLALRKHSLRALAAQAGLRSEVDALRSEVEAMLNARQAESSVQIARLTESVTELESSARSVDVATKGGMTRSARSQAMQLLRSGMSPDNAASALGIGKREMHLLADVSRILLLK